MKCHNCVINEAESEAMGLCVSCDRDEWKDATKAANERFILAEIRVRLLSEQLGHCEDALSDLEMRYLKETREK